MSNNERQGSHSRKKQLSAQQKQLIALIGGVALVVVIAVAVTVAVFFSKNRDNKPNDDSVSGSSTASGSVSEEVAYNPEDNRLDTELYTDTILPVTPDAGNEYLEDTLFIGDSNTYRYMVYSKDKVISMKNCIGITNMGIQQITSEKCVKFKGYSEFVTIPEAVKIMQPQRIIISFGTNNTDGSWSPEYMAQEYEKALKAIEDAYPYADIIINAVPPVGRHHQNERISMTTIDKFNQKLAELTEKMGYKFLNSSEVLKDPKTGFAVEGYTITDGIHLTLPAAESLFGYMRTHAYETEDRRPALKPIPARDEKDPYVIDSEKPYTDTVPGSGSSEVEGLKIIFKVNDEKFGTLEGETKQTVPEGKKCKTVEAKPKEGYVFTGWACTVGHIDDVKQEKLTFVSPAGFDVETVVVTANFAKSGHQIKVINSDPKVGTAGIRVENELREELNVQPGKKVNLYAYVNEGFTSQYEFVGWKVKQDGKEIILSTEKEYTYEPKSSETITAVFQRIAYKTSVKTDGSEGCSVISSSSNGKLTVTAEADKAGKYVFAGWTVNGNTYPEKNSTITIAIDKDLNVVANFELKEKPPVEPDSKPDSGDSESQPESKPDSKPESQPDSNSETTPEPKPDSSSSENTTPSQPESGNSVPEPPTSSSETVPPASSSSDPVEPEGDTPEADSSEEDNGSADA